MVLLVCPILGTGLSSENYIFFFDRDLKTSPGRSHAGKSKSIADLVVPFPSRCDPRPSRFLCVPNSGTATPTLASGSIIATSSEEQRTSPLPKASAFRTSAACTAVKRIFLDPRHHPVRSRSGGLSLNQNTHALILAPPSINFKKEPPSAMYHVGTEELNPCTC